MSDHATERFKMRVTSADIANSFHEMVSTTLKRDAPQASITEWYAVSDTSEYGPEELHTIPRDRRLGVFVHAKIDGQVFVFFWDDLEQMVSLLWGEDREERIAVRCNQFRELNSLREKMAAAADAVSREAFC
jgi:hypothetical protein